ncbi:hypothetical protein [Rhodococcus sp. KRD197]|uniref:hypothetical protein n=1 Tax=Rhodococcus sp. KRD197 TaxID=2729731 RepID=UPI0019D26F45|nr:hypothetical protein [Rhodococcus sp. KRD197]
MVVSNVARSWTVVFDAGRFSEYFDGVAQGEGEAIVAAIQLARLVRDAREADFAPYLSIRFGTGPADMHGSTMPMTDLDLDDETLAGQLRIGAAAERARGQSLREAMVAAEQRGPTTSPTVATSVVE